MKKAKTLQAKVTVPFYDKLSERASSEGVSLSSSVNNHLEKSFGEKEKIDEGVDIKTRLAQTDAKHKKIEAEERTLKNKNPLESIDFFQFYAWMSHKNRNMYNGHDNIKEVRYNFEILERHIDNLDFEMKILFSRVYEDLKKNIDNYNPSWGIISLRFKYGSSLGGFNYKAFEKLLIKMEL